MSDALGEQEIFAAVNKIRGHQQQRILAQVERDRARLLDACRLRPDGQIFWNEISEELGRATRATCQASRIRWWRRDATLELAWDEVHEAEAQIDRILQDGELFATARDLLAKAEKLLPPDDDPVATVRRTLEQRSEAPKRFLDPVGVAHLARAVESKIDESYVQTRTFRNRLLTLSVVSFIALGVLMWALSAGSFTLKALSPASPAGLVLLVTLFGAIGALISTVPVAAKTGGTWNPFSLPMQQLLLKLVLGPIFALLGAVLITSGAMPGIKGPMTLADLLIWSAGFGIAQQAVTRLIDTRVRGLVSSEPEDKAPEDVGSKARPTGTAT